MPGTLTHKTSDPNYNKGPEKYKVSFNRGPGVYYHRGNGWYSKYDPARDAMIIAKGFSTHKIGLPVTSKIRQAGDGYLPR